MRRASPKPGLALRAAGRSVGAEEADEEGLRMGVKVRDEPKGSGVWYVFVCHRRKRFAKKVGTDKRVAIRVAREIERALAKGDLGVVEQREATTPTLDEYATTFLARIEKRRKFTTWEDYEISFRLRILPALGPRRLGDITRADVKAFAHDLQKAEKSARNIQKTLATLSSLFGEAIEDEHITVNPARGLKKLFPAESKTIDPLTREEVAHLLATAQAHAITRHGKTVHPFRAHYPFLLLLARTGLRLGEALALKWGDIDFNGGFLTVDRAWVKGKIVSPKGSRPGRRATRRVDLSSQLRVVLREVWADRFERVVAIDAEAQAALDAERAGALDAWVFSEGPTPVDPDNLRKRVFGPLLLAAELRQITIHDLRHGYASLLLQDGVELLYVSQQLGHHKPGFTLEKYGHLIPRDRRGDIDRLDDPQADASPAQVSPESEGAGNEEGSQPVEIVSLQRAGDRGRTGDLMLGKHTL